MDINIFDVLRAKSENEETLKAHILKALERVVNLYNFVLNVNDSLEWEIYKNENLRNKFFSALAKAVILHDFGKIDYEFQKKLFNMDERDGGEFRKIKEFFGSCNNIHFKRHEVLSAIYASIILKDNEWNRKVITAILFHHYNDNFTNLKFFPEFIFDYEDEIKIYLEFIKGRKNCFEESFILLVNEIKRKYNYSFIKKAIEELNSFRWENFGEALTEIIDVYENDQLSCFTEYFMPNDEELNNKETLEFLTLLGALRRCDYSASGDVEIEKQIDKVNAKFESIVNKIKENIKKRTNLHKIKLWQEEILRNENNYKNLILIAPTGSGKTEFSILWSARSPKKLLYTLPLRVALNDLFLRFKNGYFENNNVDILHSTSFIEYLKEESGRYLDIENKVNSSKLLAAPVLLTTPDQIFLVSLNYYGSDKVLSVFPTSNIVIDEIQTYNPEMSAIIIKTLQLVKSLRGNILVMTATFPPYFEKFLENFNIIDVTKKDNVEIKNLKRKRHKIKVVKENLFKEDNLNENLFNFVQGKNNVLIVVNNVNKAINMYEKLSENKEIKKNFGDNSIFLLHSRIVEKYKTERVEEIKKRLKNKERVLVVSTQIIEASVDFDFDYMITEISPIDSQIQRWGRVYRSRKDNYNGENENIVIFVGENDFDKATLFIYDKDLLLATREILEEYKNSGVLSYKEEKEMVNNVFSYKISDNKTLKDKYTEEINKNLEFLKYFSASKKSEAQRIFRRLAGFKVVVPSLIEDEDDEEIRKFAKIVAERSNKNWREILNEIGVINGNNTKDEENIWIWKLKAKLYEYSISFPEYWTKKYSNKLNGEFKGFRILDIKDSEKEDLIKFGLDKIIKAENDDILL